jgi:hypothetical protein
MMQRCERFTRRTPGERDKILCIHAEISKERWKRHQLGKGRRRRFIADRLPRSVSLKEIIGVPKTSRWFEGRGHDHIVFSQKTCGLEWL